MKVEWQAGEVSAGSLHLGIGRNPNAYMNSGIRTTEDFREIYYRMYVRTQAGWTGNPVKLSRAIIFSSSSDWSQAMVAHIWGSSGTGVLAMEPVGCVDGSGNVKCSGYNDFDSMDWLGNIQGITPLFTTANSDNWFCVEAQVRLNDPGLSNGIQRFWIDGALEAQNANLNFVGTYTDFAINAVFFENYWNGGSPQNQQRYFDNIVISTNRIGCGD